MSKIIEANFKGKKTEQKKQAYQQVVKSNVLFVDFTQRKLVESVKTEELVTSEYDLTHFNTPPSDSNFSIFTDQERFEESEHILKYINNKNSQDISFNDILHFVEMGVLDKKKLAAKLEQTYEEDQEQAG